MAEADYTLADPTPAAAAPASPPLEGTDLAQVLDHCEDGKALLIGQFRKPRIEAMACAMLDSVQQLDDAIWQVLVGRSLDAAVGVQLDMIGWFVDLPRRGWTDDAYRLLLGAQILTLRSDGSWPALLGILEVLAVTMTLVRAYDDPPAAGRVVLGEPLDAAITATDVMGFLSRAKLGGVRLVMEYPVEAIAATFTLSDSDDGTVIDVVLGLGDTDDPGVGGALAGVIASSEAA